MRLRIIRAKNEAAQLGPFRSWLKGLKDPAWYEWANDDSGFENTCPLGVDQPNSRYTIEQCHDACGSGEGYRCKVCAPELVKKS